MAAPTSVTVEAQSMTTTVLRWAYSGSRYISVYRSTDGAAYSNVHDILGNDAEFTALEYTDTGLSAGTKYWYKLSEDLGSTFSSVVTVYTHFCAEQNAGEAFQLPRFDQGQEDPSAKLNDLAERVERALGDQVLFPQACIICPVDGAVVVDCTDSCNSFIVVADADINSFTINRCGQHEPTVDVYVPPSTTVGICGLPAGYGFTGNECTEAPVSGGTNGRTFRLGSGGPAGGAGGSGLSTPGLPKTASSTGGGGSGGGVGGTGCECIPGRNNQLTLHCCSDNCSMNCSSTKELRVKVCGGVGPYLFEHTGSIAFKKNDGTTEDTHTTGQSLRSPEVVVVPPTNSGSAVAGNAYQKCYYQQQRPNCGGAITKAIAGAIQYGCDDAEDGCTTTPTGCPNASTIDENDMTCISALSGCNLPECSSNLGGAPCSSGNQYEGAVDDMRTAGMITDGCNPCGVHAGSVVTVTDEAGVSVSITVGV